MYVNIIRISLFVLLYSAVAGLIERSWISDPIIFMGFGLIIGAAGLDLVSWQLTQETISNLAEVTLALVLFTDAASANMSVLKRTSILPTRLLLIGLPLTIVLGFIVGVWLFESTPITCIALLALLLAPTDAALGKAVILNTAVPDKVRQCLNVESGLNDGICVPILTVLLAVSLGDFDGPSAGIFALHEVIKDIAIGLGVGLVISFSAVLLLKFAWRRNWLTSTWIQIPVLALALSCFSVAQHLGGSGFIAAFSGGLLFGVLEKDLRSRFLKATEGFGDTLALITWVIFGAAVVGSALTSLTWREFLYAVLSLTVIRMLPVYLSLIGSDTSTEGRLFIGWFGPRGLATIVFTVVAIGHNISGFETVTRIVACTIILSIIFHGISANVWATSFGKRQKSLNAIKATEN